MKEADKKKVQVRVGTHIHLVPKESVTGADQEPFLIDGVWYARTVDGAVLEVNLAKSAELVRRETK